MVDSEELNISIGSLPWVFESNGHLERKLLTDRKIAQMFRIESEDRLMVDLTIVNNTTPRT